MSLAENLIGQPWLMTPSGVDRVMRDAERAKLAKGVTADSIGIVCEAPREPSAIDDNGIAHIFISGVIGHRLNFIEKFLGNTDVCDVRREIDAAMEEGARGVFLRITSPGGSVTGTVELADYLAQIEIPIYAWGDSCIASAAYWLAAPSKQIWTAPSANIGSIGILFPWIDKSVAWAQAGISFQPVSNAEAIYKSAGHGPSLTDAQKENLQEKMDRIFSLFQNFIWQQRPQADSEAMQGQTFLGMDAIGYGLVDGVGTINEAYSALCFEAGVFPRDVDLSEPLPISFQLQQLAREKSAVD